MNKIKLSCGHSGEEIPVPIPNTEVKLSNADDTALLCGKVGSCKTFLFNTEIKVKALVWRLSATQECSQVGTERSEWVSLRSKLSKCAMRTTK